MSSGIPVAHAATPSPLPTRLLGQTGAAVTLVGLGGEHRHGVGEDRGPARWMKKDLKYLDSPPSPGPALDLAGVALRPLGMFGL